MLQNVLAHKAEIIAFLFFLSEALAVIPGIKANSVFQLIFSGLQKAKDAVGPAADEPKA